MENKIRQQLSFFNNLYRKADKIYHEAARNYGFSDCAFWIIYELRESEMHYTQTMLCNMIFQPKQTINSALKKLEKDGYLELKHTSNQKSKEISLTDKGVRLSENSIDKIIEAECRAFSGLSDEERTSFLELQEKLFINLQKELGALNHN